MGDLSKDLNTIFISEHQKAFANIKFTSNWLGSIIDEKFKPYNISSQQYNILRILKGAKTPLKISVVKDRMVEKSPNTTRLMDKLFDKKLITRHRNSVDRRSVYVEITIEGLELIETINMTDKRLEFQTLTLNEQKELNRLLDKARNDKYI